MKLIFSGYCSIIMIGTLLLALPFATKGAGGTAITDCFFTATSATCVTGLIRFDTFTHWTLFGQIVILFLIQIGGIGFMTIAITLMIVMKQKIGLTQRSIMQNSISAPQIGGIVKLAKFIMLGTFVVEGIGAFLLSFYFCNTYGFLKGIYLSIFHSISAFCNAGFDLMGGLTGEYSSMTGVVGNWYVNIILMSLIVVGGLGFYVWHDVLKNKFKLKNCNLQSKLVLSISGALILGGTLVIFFLERNGEMYAQMNVGEKILASLFQSVTTRTAGFNTVDLSLYTDATKFLLICLMFIGGSTGSTAGGIKTTTFWILTLSIFSTFRRKENVEAFGRRMEENITRTASCVLMIYLLLTIASSMLISTVDNIPILTALFESVSAMATVGLSFGVTPSLGMFSKLLLAMLMLCGRVGSITLLLAFSSEKRVVSSKLPLDRVQIG